MIPETHLDLLESTALAHVATIDANGAPQVNPVWFGWDVTHLRFSNTKTRQKYQNALRDPRVAVSIVDPNNPYRYLEIRGEVVAIEEDPDLDFINAMAKKYLGMEKYPWHRPGDERVVLVIKPQRTTQMG
ncbi:MAG TPA: PPOX class F420-dependent oxidoreductase [Roseiflexaceae bacterium]|nr:PPOX class F420-dependent oxidoreductase [Roseiflexaceae bacterium]